MERTYIREQLRDSAEVKAQIGAKCAEEIISAFRALARAFRDGNKVLLCGNGGSAADAQHIAAEFVVRMSKKDRPALPAISLTTDTSALTAGGNDLGFENVFARQVGALGRESDVLIGISTSGKSENVVRAVKEARARKMVTIGFLGGDGGALRGLVDIAIVIPSADTQRIQEGHICVAHILCGLVERSLFGGGGA